LAQHSEYLGKPFPIALSMTGVWIEKHEEEFRWLCEQNQKKTLDITWVNHSYHHPYKPNVDYNSNFLLGPEVNFRQECLELEKLLLQNNQIPSIFFRFPGLISNIDLMNQLRSLGLIPLGSNAWLAKGENPTPGSIILIHGNLNEHKGVELFLDFLRENPQINYLPIQFLNPPF
jgi:hypothetical protein